jgi:hypothetical protein
LDKYVQAIVLVGEIIIYCFVLLWLSGVDDIFFWIEINGCSREEEDEKEGVQDSSPRSFVKSKMRKRGGKKRRKSPSESS